MENMQWEIPLGFRFEPTDKELFFYYLYPKASNLGPIIDIISVLDVYDKPPWHLPGFEGMNVMNHRQEDDGQQWLYFFTKIKSRSENKVDRIVGDGFWRTSTIKKKISLGHMRGWKRQFNYYSFNNNYMHFSKYDNDTKTTWIMHEYGFDDHEFEHWTLCKIRNNERGASKKRNTNWSPIATSSTVPSFSQSFLQYILDKTIW